MHIEAQIPYLFDVNKNKQNVLLALHCEISMGTTDTHSLIYRKWMENLNTIQTNCNSSTIREDSKQTNSIILKQFGSPK